MKSRLMASSAVTDMEKGLVSIVVPVYNTEKYLDRCLKSITSQTCRRLEILLIDDGSSDGSGRLCERWAEEDGRIRVFHKRNAGAGMARNTGIEAARGEYICFFDSDDCVALDVIEKALRRAQEDHSDVVVFGYYRVRRGHAPVPVIPKPDRRLYSGSEVQELFLPDLLGPDVKNGKFPNLFMGAWSLFSMELIRRTGWRFVSEREILSEDIYSQFCLYRDVRRVSVLPEPLYYYYESSGSLSHSGREERMKRINLFYSSCLETGRRLGYGERILERLPYHYLSLVMEYLKMIVSSSEPAERKTFLFRQAILDGQLQQVLSVLDFRREKPARKLLLFLMKHRLLQLCRMLIRVKARKELYYERGVSRRMKETGKSRTVVYAGRVRDREILMRSSSGGAFTALTDAFLSRGDAVAAAVYNYQTHGTEFRLILTEQERDAARGSKYMQSTPGRIFRDALSWLEANPGRSLLFVGLGCQAEGFRRFARQKGFRDRVYIIDLICFGSMSPRLWKEYALSLERRFRGKITVLTFRDKRNGWENPSAFAEINGREVPVRDYLRIYYGRCALRPSCYICPFASTERKTDITIGDYWHIEKALPDFYDPDGVSLFLIHTDRGIRLFEQIRKNLDCRRSDVSLCLQPNLEAPAQRPAGREKFWREYRRKGIDPVIKKYGAENGGRFRRMLRSFAASLPGGEFSHHPEGKSLRTDSGDGTFPLLYVKKEECCGCTACSAVCPADAIRMTADEEGFEYPRIDRSLCINCGRCVHVCPFAHINRQRY